MADKDRWLSVEEIAAHLGLSKETVYRWLDKKKIPAHRIGKLWKFRVSEVDAWIIRGGASIELNSARGSNILKNERSGHRKGQSQGFGEKEL